MTKKFILAIAASIAVLCTSPVYGQLGSLIKDAKGLKKEADKTSRDVKDTKKDIDKTSKEINGAQKDNQTEKTSPSAQEVKITGREWFISKTGSGKEGTKEKPAKEIAAIADQLKPGDAIRMAAGEYKGKLDNGTDLISVPVSIYGGYSPDFSSRDPWGAHKTILSGTNEYMKSSEPRLSYRLEKTFKAWAGAIEIDGLILDHGPRNAYQTPDELVIKRTATPEKGMNPTPEYGGIDIRAGESISITIRNCIVMNTAPTEGAIEVQIGKNSKAIIENNLIINNTGEGIYCKTSWQSDTGLPEFSIRNNSILFCWKHDAVATYGGNSLKMDTRVKLNAENNVFGFGDYGGVDNIKACKNLALNNNLFIGHRKYDYRESNDGMKVSDLEDYASCSNSGNFSKMIKIPLSERWAGLYAGRKEISREQLDASVKVSNSAANQVRSILGLPVQGSSSLKGAETWLHRMSIDDALSAGIQQYEGLGCKKP